MTKETNNSLENRDVETSEKKKEIKKNSTEISPYVFPVLLAGFGLWCFYDGWLTFNPEMQEHRLFNRIASGVLLPWAIYDFWKVRKYERKHKEEQEDKDDSDATI
jgi:hypothetical protein